MDNRYITNLSVNLQTLLILDELIVTMNPPYTQPEIIKYLSISFAEIDFLFENMDYKYFPKTIKDKWSPGQQLQHLVLSTNPLALGLKLPKAALLIFGTHPGKSKSYDEVVSDYKALLNQGAKASFLYTPNKIKSGPGSMLKKWQKACGKLITALNNWSENDLDKYCLRHPLLGKITVREMLFFTIYHTRHHKESITGLINELNK